MTIYTPNGNLVFNIGGLIFTPNWPIGPDDFKGYCEFEYEDNQLEILELFGTIIPLDINCSAVGSNAGGTMRLKYHVPLGQCRLKFKIEGSKVQQTVYDVCILTDTASQIVQDTVTIHVCSEYDQFSKLIGCTNVLYVPINEEIKTDTIVKYPNCLGELGSIEFSEYPDYNLYGLKFGQFEVRIDNGFCHKTFIFNLDPKELCNNSFYIPNAFSPNGDGINEQFLMFTIIPYIYRLKIFDRWGDCVFDKSLQSNYQGWDGGNFPVGVYAWEIFCLDKHLFGDLTLIR